MALSSSPPPLAGASLLQDPFIAQRQRSSSVGSMSDRSSASSPLSVVSAPASFSDASKKGEGSITATTSSPLQPLSPVAFTINITAAEYTHRLETHKSHFAMAQRAFPADSIVFVGNLPATADDLTLSDSLAGKLCRFGMCWVSVRRQITLKHVKPYAYVQFMCRKDALKCLTNPGLLHLRGRRLRVEGSNACRHIHVLHIDNTYVNDFEAHGVFCHFGPIDSVSFDGSKGCTMVRFRNYGSFTNAQFAVRRNLLIGYKLI